MSFSSENGYIPSTIEAIMDSIMADVNTQFGTSYTTESFVGTNHYKFYYSLVQRVESGEIKTSEIFTYLQQYFAVTNERIQRPVATNPGLIEAFVEADYVASVKPTVEVDAGKLFVCVDVDDTDPDYDDWKLEIATLIKDSSAAGVVSMGTETESIVLSNGQPFDFKFNLPNRIPVGLKLTVTLSDNNQELIGNPDEVKNLLIENIQAKYRLGRDFEPQKYFSTADAPWASQVLLEWTDDVTDGEVDIGATYHDEIYEADYDDLFEISLELITLVED